MQSDLRNLETTMDGINSYASKAQPVARKTFQAPERTRTEGESSSRLAAVVTISDAAQAKSDGGGAMGALENSVDETQATAETASRLTGYTPTGEGISE